jgi:hypothetical protein
MTNKFVTRKNNLQLNHKTYTQDNEKKPRIVLKAIEEYIRWEHHLAIGTTINKMEKILKRSEKGHSLIKRYSNRDKELLFSQKP